MRTAIIMLILVISGNLLAQPNDQAPLIERLGICQYRAVGALLHCDPMFGPKNEYPFDPENADIWSPNLYKLNPNSDQWWKVGSVPVSAGFPPVVPASPLDPHGGTLFHRTTLSRPRGSEMPLKAPPMPRARLGSLSKWIPFEPRLGPPSRFAAVV